MKIKIYLFHCHVRIKVQSHVFRKNQKQYNRHVPNMKHFVSTHLFDYHAIIVNTGEC